MKAVILAAGRGTRMSNITEDKPKCLINISGKTILERQIEILLKYSIKQIYVVIGYKTEKIREKMRNIESIEMIENKEYATTDNIYSLYLTLDKVKGEEFILLNGDAVFEEEIIRRVVARKGLDIAPVDIDYYDLEELKIREKNGFVTEILPKAASKKISNGSTIGVFKFSSEGSNALFYEIQSLIEKGAKNKWFEYALNNILRKIKMYIINVSGLKWMEVDTLEDIKKSQVLFGE